MANSSTGEQQIEHTLQNLTPGIANLAGFMSLTPQTGIFRTFRALNYQALLFKMSEIEHLEVEFRKLEREDNESKEGARRLYGRDYNLLKLSGNSVENSEDSKQMKLFRVIMEKLEYYSKWNPVGIDILANSDGSLDKSLQTVQSISGMAAPSDCDLNAIRDHQALRKGGSYVHSRQDCKYLGYYNPP